MLEEIGDRVLVEFRRGCVPAKVRRVVSALLKILIARGTFLTIPTLFIDQRDCGEQREFFHGQSHMCEVSDGAMSVLEVKSI